MVHTIHMKLTGAEFRKKLSPSKLPRAKRRRALLCDPDGIVHSDKKLLAEMEAEWRKDWKKL